VALKALFRLHGNSRFVVVLYFATMDMIFQSFSCSITCKPIISKDKWNKKSLADAIENNKNTCHDKKSSNFRISLIWCIITIGSGTSNPLWLQTLNSL
jgi:hypothetical protein